MTETPLQENHPVPVDMTVRQFQDLIRERYFASDNARGTAGTFLYLTEEFGELATALANNNRPNRPPTEAEKVNGRGVRRCARVVGDAGEYQWGGSGVDADQIY